MYLVFSAEYLAKTSPGVGAPNGVMLRLSQRALPSWSFRNEVFSLRSCEMLLLQPLHPSSPSLVRLSVRLLSTCLSVRLFVRSGRVYPKSPFNLIKGSNSGSWIYASPSNRYGPNSSLSLTKNAIRRERWGQICPHLLLRESSAKADGPQETRGNPQEKELGMEKGVIAQGFFWLKESPESPKNLKISRISAIDNVSGAWLDSPCSFKTSENSLHALESVV